MLKMLFRLLFSFSLILSIGYSQVYLAFSQGVNYLESTSTSVDQIDPLAEHPPVQFAEGLNIHEELQKQVLDLDSLVLEKEPEVHIDVLSLDFQLAFVTVFLFLLSLSIRVCQTRFLRFYQNFSFTYSHRLHLYNRVFTI